MSEHYPDYNFTGPLGEPTYGGVSPRVMRKQLIRDDTAYVESLGGNQDNLGEMLRHTDGEGTVVRLFFGASRKLPFRALSYVASAARVAQMLPAEQVQVICTSAVGERVNGIPADEAADQFKGIARFGNHILQHTMPDMLERTIFAHDIATPATEELEPLVEQALLDDPVLRQILSNKGAKHNGDFVAYGAAHVAYQDTGRLELDSPDQVSAKRIISVGGQSERPFFALRQAVRGLMPEDDLAPALQVFTRHVSPPYYPARGGEPLLDDVIARRELVFSAPDPAARRDLQHLSAFMNPERNHP